MKSILLIGLGRFGRHIAIKLHELRHQVMAVDWREECVEAALPYVTSAQIGDSKNEEFMASLGVRNFDVCIVAIGDVSKLAGNHLAAEGPGRALCGSARGARRARQVSPAQRRG